MISLNKATIIGNTTKEIELRYTPNGQAVCNFSVATNRRFKNAQGDLQEDTQYHDVVAWGKLAEIINQIIKKGAKIYVEGRLQTRQWEAPDGSKRYRTEIIMEQFIPLTPKGQADSVSFGTSDEQESEKPDAEDKKPIVKSKDTKETKPKSDNLPSDDEVDLDDIPF